MTYLMMNIKMDFLYLHLILLLIFVQVNTTKTAKDAVATLDVSGVQ